MNDVNAELKIIINRWMKENFGPFSTRHIYISVKCELFTTYSYRGNWLVQISSNRDCHNEVFIRHPEHNVVWHKDFRYIVLDVGNPNFFDELKETINAIILYDDIERIQKRAKRKKS